MIPRTRLARLPIPACALLALCSCSTPTIDDAADAPYYLDDLPVSIDTRDSDRYACRNGRLLVCERSTRGHGPAECRCLSR